MSRSLLRALLVFGVLANLAFLAINFRPDRPHLKKHRPMSVLLRTEPERANWIRDNELAEFGAANDIDFVAVPVDDYDKIPDLLAAEKQHPTNLLLSAIEDDLDDELQAQGSVMALENFVPKAELKEGLSEFTEQAQAACADKDGKIWFWPKRSEVPVAVFLLPAVEEAYLNWEKDRPAIEAALKEANGKGLPHDYFLEKEPDNWDSYDLFVAAWYWAHHPASWADPPGSVAPRIAYRTGDNDDAVDDLIGMFYSHGLTDADLGSVEAPAVIDSLAWLALMRKHNLLATESLSDAGINDDGVANLFRDGKLAWVPIDQEDSLSMHGGARRDAEPGIAHPGWVDWSPMPSGSSLEMKGDQPARKGKSFSFVDLHLWAVPIHSPDPQLAFDLMRFVSQRGIQMRETSAQGLLPVRQDLALNYPILFRLDWMQRMLDASYDQLRRGSQSLPDAVADHAYGSFYARLAQKVWQPQSLTQPLTTQRVRALALSAQASLAKEATHGGGNR